MTAAMLTNGYVVMRTTSLLSFPAPVHNCKLLKGFSQSESQLLPLPDGPLTLKEQSAWHLPYRTVRPQNWNSLFFSNSILILPPFYHMYHNDLSLPANNYVQQLLFSSLVTMCMAGHIMVTQKCY